MPVPPLVPVPPRTVEQRHEPPAWPPARADAGRRLDTGRAQRRAAPRARTSAEDARAAGLERLVDTIAFE
jgi:hypothetical protein